MSTTLTSLPCWACGEQIQFARRQQRKPIGLGRLPRCVECAPPGGPQEPPPAAALKALLSDAAAVVELTQLTPAAVLQRLAALRVPDATPAAAAIAADDAPAVPRKASKRGRKAEAATDAPTVKTPQKQDLAIAAIQADPGLQCRTEKHDETVASYTTLIQDGTEFPPVVVFHDDSTYWLADGFYRLEAHHQAGRTHITAEVHVGTRRDALLHAVGANGKHGRPRSKEDKHRAVQLLLDDPEWAQRSNREVARVCVVDETLVRTLRPKPSAAQPQMEVRRDRRNGSHYEMKTPRIGKRPPKANAQPKRKGSPAGEDPAPVPEPSLPDEPTPPVNDSGDALPEEVPPSDPLAGEPEVARDLAQEAETMCQLWTAAPVDAQEVFLDRAGLIRAVG